MDCEAAGAVTVRVRSWYLFGFSGSVLARGDQRVSRWDCGLDSRAGGRLVVDRRG